LRARHGDVLTLARHFARAMEANDDAFSAELLLRWEAYAWPGNVRELRNAVARYLALGENGPEPGAKRRKVGGDVIERVLSMDLPIGPARDRVIEEFERRYLERLMAQHAGVVTHAAKAAGDARRHFQRLRARRHD
jgi:DNA-binding NtrC family response regulator